MGHVRELYHIPVNAEGESATRFRTVRGGVADQPQQFFHAGALRLVEDDTAAVRFWRRGKRAFIFNFSNELNDHKLNHAACDFRTAEIRSVKLKAPTAVAPAMQATRSYLIRLPSAAEKSKHSADKTDDS